ncbi:MarC family protein [Lebetimonas sp. JS138]|uniref:MarC family protein n=1 Tax=Lebetimonas sp. JS138 TaxID=990072 RepID=UPI0004663C93|nr:MarC family protein [Lebetimonas sp. JS138]
MLKAILFDTISLITILNPIAAAAVMISLVKYSDIPSVSKVTSFTVLIASIITMIAGGWVLKIFGINLPSIKAIGGVVLLIIALNMIQGKEISPTNTTKDEHEAAQEKENIAIIPLAIPVLFGPGVITTIIVLSEKSKKLIDKGVLFTAIVLSALIVYITLKNASFISKFLGVNGIKIVTRIMGLIIGAISFLFLIGGVKALWLIS